MSNLSKLRQKIQSSKKVCLLKKIKFYEYLISYNATIDFQKPQAQYKTSNSFFPHINYHVKNSNKQITNTQVIQSSQNKNITKLQQESVGQFMSYSSRNQQGKQVGRKNNKQQLKNIAQLVAKSMTPSSKINRPIFQNQKMQLTSYKKQRNASTISHQQKKYSLKRKLSPRKRTYIGNAFYIKQKSLYKPIQYNRARKQSVTPWQIDLQNIQKQVQLK